MRTLQNVLTEREAASYIGMSRSFLRAGRMNGQREGHMHGPPFLKLGHAIRYLVADLDQWLLAHRQELPAVPQDGSVEDE